ncbi:hypothetical protein BDN72DRAFT_949637, partial [Pluteus cervinus]
SNQRLFEATAAKLRQRVGHTSFKKVKGHSGDEGNEGADQKANEGAHKAVPDELDITVPKELKVTGAKLSSMTQSTLYKGVLYRVVKEERRRTRTNLDLIRHAVHDQFHILPTDETIWASFRNRDISRNIRSFMWRATHESYKCGKYWLNIPGYEERATCSQCDVTETMSHILVECPASGQETIWKLARGLLEAKGIEWWEPTLGGILGCAMADTRNETGRKLPGHNRLYRIVISESMHLIWRLRCEWRIQRDSNPQKKHTTNEIENRWTWIIDNRIKLDCTLTNHKVYGKKSLNSKRVFSTWNGVLENERDLPRNWANFTGVLVGIRARRPPGRNR